jgi:electron transport complex protein RnfG
MRLRLSGRQKINPVYQKSEAGGIQMKEMIRYGFTLGLICAIAGGLLASANALTKSRIIAQVQAEEEMGLKEVLPGAAHFEPVKSRGEIIYYKGHDKEGRLAGIAFKATGKGYSSTVETVAGMKSDGTIIAIKVVSQNETPGLGSGVTESEFTGQFAGRNITDLNKVQAIIGATISSRAVIDSVRKKAEEIKSLIKDEK